MTRMFNGGRTFSNGMPSRIRLFLNAIWEHYCELMLVYLVAMGSPLIR